MGLLAEEKLQDTNSGRKSPMPTIPAFYGPAMSPAPAPFRFSAHQTRINWQILHGVDIDKLVRTLYNDPTIIRNNPPHRLLLPEDCLHPAC